MASSEKRCLYEVLGLAKDCAPDEIRSAYKKLALQRHPDKLIKSGVPESEATASFQELVNAYEVLSDPKERAWYDSHRSQILFSSSSNGSASSGYGIPDLFPFFSNSVYNGYSDSGKGFYKVYGEVFDKIYQNEVNFAKKLGLNLPKEAPLMGNLNSYYTQVTAFYSYWMGFVTLMDFCWVDQYDAMAGVNRKSRRVMEEENKKLRKKAKREYNDTVRGLAEFVKKRDKRVIDMKIKKNEEMERKKEQERERKKELERQKAERAKKYDEPQWAKVEDMEDEEFEEEVEQEEKKKGEGREFYCVACGKKFKSEKQWKNHEQSKKHKDKVAELREAFIDEDDEFEEAEIGEEDNMDQGEDVYTSHYLSADDGVEELRQELEGAFTMQPEESDNDEVETSEEDSFFHIDSSSSGFRGVGVDVGSDDEVSILEAMVSGHKNRNNVTPTHRSSRTVEAGVDSDEMDFMEYNNTKASRRNRGARRQRGRRNEEDGETVRPHHAKPDGGAEEINCNDSGSHAEDPRSDPLQEHEPIDTAVDDPPEQSRKLAKQASDKKGAAKDNNTKSKNAVKGRKQKGTAKASSNTCDTCQQEFESRNKLHKHLGETGHGTLKSR